jgi:predicted Zn-dependent peptidase
VKLDDMTQLDGLKKKLQAEQANLKQLSIRLAAKIDKQAMQKLNNYLAEKKATAASATAVNFAANSFQQVDIFDQTDAIAMLGDGLSWQAMYTELVEDTGGLFSDQIVKDNDKYKELIRLWLSALVHYGRAKALEKLVNAHIKQVRARADEAAAAKQRLIDELLASHTLLTGAAKVGGSVDDGNWYKINPDNRDIIVSTLIKVLTLNGHTV